MKNETLNECMCVQTHSKENGKIVFPGALFAAAMGGDEPEAPAVEDAPLALPPVGGKCELHILIYIHE